MTGYPISGSAPAEYHVGLMSGTSLDGADAVLADFTADKPEILGHAHLPYPRNLRKELLELHQPSCNEIEKAELIAIQLSRLYAQCVAMLLEKSAVPKQDIAAIGCHGQTVRHRPESGYSVQLVNAPLLAEFTGIAVVSNFRNRDIAAGGQGAPLVPAFHAAMFRNPKVHRAVLNLGGIANLTDLPATGPVTGFDCGPANMLMDAWIESNLGKTYDEGGNWASSGKVIDDLLESLMQDDYFWQEPPKSTGRDRFNLEWLRSRLKGGEDPAGVQATLLQLTARSIADAVRIHCIGAREIYLCGGGAYNTLLRKTLEGLLPGLSFALTDELGIDACHMEAAAFAWLARQAMKGLPGNLPEVTGARGKRILGAIHPA